ncbi:MAG: copper(I)-binding protein [Glaciecola sp.]|jgi:copper(I)-binding protein
MFQFNKILFAFFISVILLANSANLCAHEHEHEQAKGKVTVENAWARATFALAKTGAVYLSIDNQSKNDIKLLSVSVDPSVASDAQLHEILMQDEMMLMREAEDGFEISAGSSLEFLTGGKHIMLVDLEKPLSRGENFVLSLIFEKNKVMRVPIEVKDAR